MSEPDPFEEPLYDSGSTLGPLSAALGLMTIVGQCFCCVPCINMIAVFVVPVLGMLAVGTGFAATRSADPSARSMGWVGLSTGGLGLLMFLVWFGLQFLSVFVQMLMEL